MVKPSAARPARTARIRRLRSRRNMWGRGKMAQEQNSTQKLRSFLPERSGFCVNRGCAASGFHPAAGSLMSTGLQPSLSSPMPRFARVLVDDSGGRVFDYELPAGAAEVLQI